jgi:lysophospholipase L1-like esterase
MGKPTGREEPTGGCNRAHSFHHNPLPGRGGIGRRLVGTALGSVRARVLASTALVPRAVGLSGLVLLTALLPALAACSPEAESGEQRTGERAQQGLGPQETMAAPERAAALEGATEAATDSRTTWDYVALGDSLAVGVGANRGYVQRYAEHLRSDTGARIRVVNLGLSGQTSSQLLHALRNDTSMRRAIGRAEVVTVNIGINDLGYAGRSYKNGSCGGPQNQRCLRAAVEKVEENWDAVIEEILHLRSTNEAIVRTAGLGYTPRVDGMFEPYLAKVNRHIAASATDNGIPYAQVRLGEEGISPDGVHPNDRGYEVIADRLRELGYELLSPP